MAKVNNILFDRLLCLSVYMTVYCWFCTGEPLPFLEMQRLSLLCGLVLAAAAVCGLQWSFVTVDARSNARSPVMQKGLPQMPRASVDTETSWTAWTATGVLAVGAALALKSQRRDDSSMTMFSKHDKRTFRGKQHAHTFGKYRLRKNKARRIQAIKNGTFDPEKVVQRGQPEPEHPWDLDNIIENPILARSTKGRFRLVHKGKVHNL